MSVHIEVFVRDDTEFSTRVSPCLDTIVATIKMKDQVTWYIPPHLALDFAEILRETSEKIVDIAEKMQPQQEESSFIESGIHPLSTLPPT